MNEVPRTLRVVPSRIDLVDVSGRVLFPTPVQGPWLPFEWFAETTASSFIDDPGGHDHEQEEVLNYVVEGRVEYEDEHEHSVALEPGTVVLLSARGKTHHKLVQKPGPRTRWLSVVVRYPATVAGPAERLQVGPATRPAPGVDGTIERSLVGPGSTVESATGLECVEIEFTRSGLCVRPVARDRRVVAYLFEGSGEADGQFLTVGTGALLENVKEFSFRGVAGTRMLVATVRHRSA